MVERLRIPEEWATSLRESYAAYPEGERCFYEIPEGRFAKRPPTLTRVWPSVQSVHVSVGGAGRRVCNPRLYEHAQRVVWCDLVELKCPGALCVKGGFWGGGRFVCMVRVVCGL